MISGSLRGWWWWGVGVPGQVWGYLGGVSGSGGPQGVSCGLGAGQFQGQVLGVQVGGVSFGVPPKLTAPPRHMHRTARAGR